jgi:hypothetical protein
MEYACVLEKVSKDEHRLIVFGQPAPHEPKFVQEIFGSHNEEEYRSMWLLVHAKYPSLNSVMVDGKFVQADALTLKEAAEASLCSEPEKGYPMQFSMLPTLGSEYEMFADVTHNNEVVWCIQPKEPVADNPFEMDTIGVKFKVWRNGSMITVESNDWDNGMESVAFQLVMSNNFATPDQIVILANEASAMHERARD